MNVSMKTTSQVLLSTVAAFLTAVTAHASEPPSFDEIRLQKDRIIVYPYRKLWSAAFSGSKRLPLSARHRAFALSHGATIRLTDEDKDGSLFVTARITPRPARLYLRYYVRPGVPDDRSDPKKTWFMPVEKFHQGRPTADERTRLRVPPAAGAAVALFSSSNRRIGLLQGCRGRSE